MNIHFAYPLWLALGAAAALILFLALHKNEKRRQLALERFSTPRLSPQLLRNISRRRRLLKNILAALALFCAFVAVARPRYGYRIEEVKRRGIDILFAVDTSRSMLAEDVRPNRLTRAKLAIYDFVHQLNGDRVGLLPFAGDSWLMCPLTLDYAAFDQSLESIDTAIIPRGGTNIAAVIDRAVSILGTGSNHRILLLITDGENLEGDVVAAAESAAKAGLTIYTVGVGTESGELIPLADGRGVVRNRAGEPVRSKLDVAVLTKTAAATGGIYTPLGSEGLESIYRQKLARIPKAELSSRHRRVAAERFQWPLAAALLLLIVEFLISDRSREKARHHKSTAGVAALLLISFLTVTEAVATAATSSTADSDVLFRPASDEPKQPLLFYNHGTALYKNGDYDKAIVNFTRTLESRDLNLQAKAYYNRGCALFQKGAQQVKNDPQTTIDNWEQAVKSFASAATINPEDSSAAANRDWVQKQLQTLKQQQEKAQKEKEKRKQSAADSETQQKNTAEKKRSETKKQNAKDTAADKKEKTEAPPEKRQQAAGKQHKSQQQKGSATTADPASSSSEQRKPGAPQQTAQSATTQPGREQHQEKPASQSWLDRIRQQLEQLTQKKKAQQAAGKQHKPPQEKGSATSSTSDDSGSSGKHRQKEAPQKPAQSATTAPDNGQKKQDAAGITTESRQTADNRVQVPSQPGKENSRGQTIAAGPQSAELARAQQAEAEAAGREQAQIRRASGKMTREEALQILKAVKTETKTLRFVPGPTSGEPKESRDW